METIPVEIAGRWLYLQGWEYGVALAELGLDSTTSLGVFSFGSGVIVVAVFVRLFVIVSDVSVLVVVLMVAVLMVTVFVERVVAAATIRTYD